MAINRVEIKDFLVFNGEFAADFCPGVNVLIGANGTGKTTLMRRMYEEIAERYFLRVSPESRRSIPVEMSCANAETPERIRLLFDSTKIFHTVYIPEKDILEHAKGLLPFIEQKPTGFSRIYRDILVNAQDIPMINQTDTQKEIGEIIADIIGGYIEWEQSEGSFYTMRTDGARIPFATEASGFKKLGFLGLLVASGQLEKGSVLFWDEPENSLNPELVPILVNVLLELSRNGVQIFIATHDYNLARYFDVRKDKEIPVMFHNLSKTDTGQIISNSSIEYLKLADNHLETASKDLFKAVVADAMGARDDE